MATTDMASMEHFGLKVCMECPTLKVLPCNMDGWTAG